MQVHENEYNQPVILAKQAKRVISLLHTRDKNRNKIQEMPKCSTAIITFKTKNKCTIKTST